MRAMFVLAALLAAAAAAPASGGGTSLVRPAWLAPIELTPRADYSIGDQNVAVDAHGDALLVWSVNNRGPVLASYRPAGGAWGAPAQVDACGVDVQVAFDAAGVATVVWLQCTPVFTRVAVAERHVDGSWTAPVVLSTPGRSVAYPNLAVAASGAAAASWIENDGHFSVVQASVRDPGSDSWAPAAQVSVTGANAEDSSVALDSAGDAVVGFTRDDAPGAIVWAAFRPAGGAWQRAVNLSPPGDYAYYIQVAARPDGTMVAFWDEAGTARLGIRSPATGAWSEQSPQTPFYAVKALVADDVGDVAAAWQADNVTVSELPAGSDTWQAPVAVPSTPPGLQTFTIGFDGARGLVAVWATGADIDTGSLFASRQPAGGSWESPVTRTGVSGLFYLAHTGIDSDGDAVVSYETPVGASVASIVLDSAAPQATSVTIPRAGRATRRLAFAATPADISTVTFRWRFGDGKTAAGASVRHAYRKAGRYVVTLVATDAAGHAATVARTSVRISAARS